MGVHTDKLKEACRAHGLTYVGTRGSQSAPVVFVGEAPGTDEDKLGTPFVGFSGKELDRMIEEAGLASSACWFTNTFKVRPPDNDITRLGELGICEEFYEKQFFEELEENKPSIIVACGATPLSVLCPETRSRRDSETKISLWRGSLLRCNRLQWPHYVVPVYHPAFILREWAERQVAVFCIARAKEELDFFRKNGMLQPLTERELIVTPSYETTVQYLNTCLSAETKLVSIDIELIRRMLPYTISLASSALSAISFSFWDYETSQCAKIWRLLEQVLRTKPQVGQNYLGFDLHWLQSIGFSSCPSLVNDTMVAHHILWPEFPHKLQFQTFQYTREPYYKDEGKSWKPSEKQRLMRYNAKDSAVTYEIWERQLEEFTERPALKRCFDYEMELARRFHEIEKRGVLMHPEKLEKLRYFVEAELDKSTTKIESLLGKPVAHSSDSAVRRGLKEYFNLNSPTQIVKILQTRGLRVPKSRQSGRATTSEDKINELFAETGDEILKEILSVRENTKMLGTYINAKLAKNVMYCSYVVTGTVTGRRSSRVNVFGYGTNHQNQPKHTPLANRFRECYIARPGHIFVMCDQMQAEDWVLQAIIADESGITTGLDELKSGIDRHARLASFLVGKPLAECHKGTFYRDVLGKRVRYAASFDMRENRLAQVFAKEGYDVKTEYCKLLLEKFHAKEPQIRGVYHEFVKRELTTKRTLRNPFARERYFFALRPFADNTQVFKEGYAWIPQSTVGDNTGLAIVYVEQRWPKTIMDIHDQIVLEVADRDDSIKEAVYLLQRAFNRFIQLRNGTLFKIPVEYEIGYDLRNTIKCKEPLEIGLKAMYNSLRSHQKALASTISGAV